jgi:hypothetical protein
MKSENKGIFENIDSVSSIIFAMVAGIRKKWVEINMNTFGEIEQKSYFFGLIKKDVCYGCAATNTLCELMDKPFTLDNIYNRGRRAKEINFGISHSTLFTFEKGIDYLRTGNVDQFLYCLKIIEKETGIDVSESMKTITDISKNFNFVELDNDNYKQNLVVYEDFASELAYLGF